MSFIELSTTQQLEVSPEFKELLQRIEPFYQQTIDGQHAKMMMIGECKTYQQQFPQRSQEHRIIFDTFRNEGWSESTVSRGFTAYQCYKQLKSNGNPEFEALAEDASFRQLYELGTAKDGTLLYDAAMHLKRCGKVPPVKALAGYKGGYYSKKFEPNSRPRIADTTPAPTVHKPYVAPEPPQQYEAVATIPSPPVVETVATPIESHVQEQTTAEVVGLMDNLQLTSPDPELKAKQEQAVRTILAANDFLRTSGFYKDQSNSHLIKALENITKPISDIRR